MVGRKINENSTTNSTSTETLKEFVKQSKKDLIQFEHSRGIYELLIDQGGTFLPEGDKYLKELVDKQVDSKKLNGVQEEQKNVLREKQGFSLYSLMALVIDNNKKLAELVYPKILNKQVSEGNLSEEEKKSFEIIQDYLVSQISLHSLDDSFLREDQQILPVIARADKVYKNIQVKNKENEVDQNDNQVMLIYLRELFSALYIEKKLAEKNKYVKSKSIDNKAGNTVESGKPKEMGELINSSILAGKEVKCFKAPYWMDNQRGIDLILCVKMGKNTQVLLLDTKFRLQDAISEPPAPRTISEKQKKVIEELVEKNYDKDGVITVAGKTLVVTMDVKEISNFAKQMIVG
ncbi:MAG TPA: hypothetical protein PKC14_02105 [Candidatus Absconditabacterales bacterium]|nr:hypothetical protein [Candidatus Absconditabacterales bacterium]